MALDCNGRWCYLDPKTGAMHAVAEAARNVACVGARPVAATNCLNFGNPEKPPIMQQFSETVDGLAAACEALGTPITGGNVSLYNETDGQAIYPTPVIGVVGVMEDASRVLTRAFQASGHAIVLLGDDRGELGGSEYLKVVHGLVRGDAPAFDAAREAALIKLVTDAASAGLLRSAHDCSDGGLAVTLAESCFNAGGIGGSVALASDVELFSESASRILVSVDASKEQDLLRRAAAAGVPARRIGTTGGSRIEIFVKARKVVDVAVTEAENLWATALEKHFKRAVA